MIRPHFDQHAGIACAAAMATVTRAAGREESAAQRTVVETSGRLFFGVDDPYALAPISPADLAAAVDFDEGRDFLSEMLVLAALVDVRPDHGCCDAAAEYCRVLKREPENLAVIHDVVHRHIRRAHLHLYQRYLLDGMRTGNLKSDVSELRTFVRESHENPGIAAPYLALENFQEDTFGSHFYYFRVNRGWKFPGQKGALPTLYGFELHDSIHVLSGYNTSATDEINVIAFQAGASSTLSWLLIAVNLVTFNSGLPYGPANFLKYRPQEGNLDPEAFIRALDRGLAVTNDLSRHFNLHEHWNTPLHEVRERLGIISNADVRRP